MLTLERLGHGTDQEVQLITNDNQRVAEAPQSKVLPVELV